MRLAFALAFAASVCAAPAARAAPAAELLRRSVAAHPDDAALARALAASQLAEGDAAGALATLEAHLARQPGHRAACAQLLGRALLASGDLAGARAALAEAVAHRETDAVAHLYLGLAALRLGDRAAAEPHLARAAELDPRLVERVRAAPTPSAGRLARPLQRFTFSGGAGVEYDTNSTLEGDEDITSLPGDRADGRVRYDAAIGATLLRSERAELAAGYRIEENDHRELSELDVQSHGVFLGGTLALSPATFVRLESGAALHRLDDHTHLRSASLASGFGWLSERRGAFELRAQAERRAFAEPPAISSLERDGWRVGGALRHSLPLPRLARSALTTQLGYVRTLTEAERDPFGFAGAFDSHLVSLDSALRWPLPARLHLDARLGFAAERFDARNVVDFLSDDGVGDPAPERRRDYAVEASLTLSHALTRWLDLQLRVRETRRFSNVDVYDWDRQIVGTQVRLRWPPR